MRKKLRLITILIAAVSCVTQAQEPVHFADANLKEAVEKTLGISDPNSTDILKLTFLNANNRDIEYLTGLEYATNLRGLDLFNNHIRDISVISELINLRRLELRNNDINDITAVRQLTNLKTLRLSENQIADISAIAGLANLTELWLGYNQISDFSVVWGLTNLTILDICYNPVELDNNISDGLWALRNLRQAWLQCLGISDISAVSGMSNLTVLWLSDNQITDISAVEGLTNLTYLWLHNNQITDISPVAGLINLNELSLNNNRISDFTPVWGLTNLTILDLSNNPVSSVSDVSDGLWALKKLIATQLNDLGISDISAISVMPNLLDLRLQNNQISDISAVSGLTNLSALALSNNQITDISPIVGLTNLTDLKLANNQIYDLSAWTAWSGLGNLTRLELGGNMLYDISPLSVLTNLMTLDLHDNQISDISELRELTNLNELWLDRNNISDISVLSNLVNVQQLYLHNNDISDISPLIKLMNIARLELQDNSLDMASYCEYMPLIKENNPDAEIIHDPNPFDCPIATSQCPAGQDLFWVSWSDAPSVGKIDVSTGINTDVFSEIGSDFDGIYVGRTKIYLTHSGEITKKNGDLRCINRFGDPNPQILVTGLDFPGHPTVNWQNEYIYWTENDGTPMGQPDYGGRVCRAKLSDNLPLIVESLVTEGTGRPQGIALEATGRFLYYSDTGLGEISRYDLNTGERTIIHAGLNKPYCLAISGEEMVWTENGAETIAEVWKSNLDGNDKTRLALMGGGNPDSAYGITIISNKVYWSDAGEILWTNINGGSINTLYIKPDGPYVAGLACEPPTITATAEPLSMWPPDHEYHTFTLADFNVSLTGSCNAQDIPVIISKVSCDEPENAPNDVDGDVTTFDDIIIAPDGKSVQLRAERQDSGNGRVYTVYFSGTNVSHDTNVASCQVMVPYDLDSTAIDDGPFYWVQNDL